MEEITIAKKKLSFKGTGEKYFGIFILNALLNLVTLGIYYAWSKKNRFTFFYEETELDNSRFEFHGTGKEMFIGYMKAVGIFGGISLVNNLTGLYEDISVKIAAIVISVTLVLIVVPMAMHGTARYRLSRSSYRGIHFGYRGDRADLMEIYIIGALLSIITLGIYYPWFKVKTRKYMIENIRYGNISATFHGNGEDLFLIYIKGILLSIITLGVYYFWFLKDLYNFNANHIKIHQDNRIIHLRANVTGLEFLELKFVNFVLVLFTFGLGTPWAEVRDYRFMITNFLIEGELDLDNVHQTEEDYKNATADDLSDMMDIQF